MDKPDLIRALEPVVDVFDQLGIQYYIGGSVASSVYGTARTTADVDLVAAIETRHVEPLILQLGSKYYANKEAIQDAIQCHRSFNLIHLDTMMKVDVFTIEDDAHSVLALERKRPDSLDPHYPRPFMLASPEDTILAKLNWQRQAGGFSERQRKDILGILQIQANRMDMTYLRNWASKLGLLPDLDELLNDVADEP